MKTHLLSASLLTTGIVALASPAMAFDITSNFSLIAPNAESYDYYSVSGYDLDNCIYDDFGEIIDCEYINEVEETSALIPGPIIFATGSLSLTNIPDFYLEDFENGFSCDISCLPGNLTFEFESSYINNVQEDDLYLFSFQWSQLVGLMGSTGGIYVNFYMGGTSFDYIESYGSGLCEPYLCVSSYGNFSMSGAIVFDEPEVEPASVPEPASFLGIMVLGLGFLFSRSQKNEVEEKR